MIFLQLSKTSTLQLHIFQESKSQKLTYCQETSFSNSLSYIQQHLAYQLQSPFALLELCHQSNLTVHPLISLDISNKLSDNL